MLMFPKMFYKCLKLHAYKIQLKYEIRWADIPKRVEFSQTMLNAMGDNENDLNRIFMMKQLFIYMALFNFTTLEFGGSATDIFYYVRKSPKMNMWTSREMFMFDEKTITGITYLNMFKLCFSTNRRHTKKKWERKRNVSLFNKMECHPNTVSMTSFLTVGLVLFCGRGTAIPVINDLFINIMDKDYSMWYKH